MFSKFPGHFEVIFSCPSRTAKKNSAFQAGGSFRGWGIKGGGTFRGGINIVVPKPFFPTNLVFFAKKPTLPYEKNHENDDDEGKFLEILC